jgi:hypothetical protein
MEAMTDRVLRWLFAVALLLLALDATFNIDALPWFADHFTALGPSLVISWGPGFILVYQALPATAAFLGQVTGVAALVVSLQRRQWGWFSALLLALLVANYASLALNLGVLSHLTGGASSVYSLTMAFQLYADLTHAPVVVVAGAYAWTRRQPATTSTGA